MSGYGIGSTSLIVIAPALLALTACCAPAAAPRAGASAPSAQSSAPRAPASAPAPTLVELYADDRFFEGPCWNPAEGKLYFTAFGPAGQELLRLEAPGQVTVWMSNTEGVNGTFRALDGRLLGAQAYGHRLLALPLGGPSAPPPAVLAADPAWNQPNDVCQSPAGDIYFTDPDFKQRTDSRILRLAPDGRVSTVISDMAVPNGIICANDGRTLYVSDSHHKHWRAYPIAPDGTVGPGRLFFDPPVPDRSDPDGMTIDEHGNLYLAGRGGVWVVSPAGVQREFIPVPEFCSNLTFGGPEGRTLFLTCKGKVYSLEREMRGGPSSGLWDAPPSSVRGAATGSGDLNSAGP